MSDLSHAAPTILTAANPKQSLFARVGWFTVGGLMSSGLNATVYKSLETGLHWPQWLSYATSLTTVSLVFAAWNYYVNFKTDRSLRESTLLYGMCVALAAVLNYSLVLVGFKFLGSTWEHAWALIIATVQVGMGGVKFLVYHFWVYPRVGARA